MKTDHFSPTERPAMKRKTYCDATPREKRWWKRFRRCLNEMPQSMEVLVGAHGQICAAGRGASDEEFKRKGDVDNVPRIDLPSWSGKGVENNGSSL